MAGLGSPWGRWGSPVRWNDPDRRGGAADARNRKRAGGARSKASSAIALNWSDG
jgi:hypothetical protein